MTADPDAALENEFRTFEQRWDSITDVPEEPRTLMDVIEYGLGKQRRAEIYVNRLLAYLLAPDESHGMGTAFLEAFLGGLPAECGFDEDTYDLSDVRVNQQVQVEEVRDEAEDDEDSSGGIVDLVIDVPNEWFVLIELKFSAQETGTEFYCRASNVGDHRVSDYESGRYYLYLHQQNRPRASGDCFANWTWQGFVDDVLDQFVAEKALQYPHRTVTQLHDLRDDVREISAMSDRRDVDQQKIALYLDHSDAIVDVTNAFDDAWDSYNDQWGERLATSLEGERISTSLASDDANSRVTITREDGDTEEWILRGSDNDWQHAFKRGWWQRQGSGEPLAQRADDYDDFRIGFYHRMGEDYKETAVRDREVEFNFRCMGSNPTDFRNVFNEVFDERIDEVERLLSRTAGELTGHKRTMIRARYDVDVDAHDGFFEAYTAALREGFVDSVVETPELVALLGEVFEESIERYD